MRTIAVCMAMCLISTAGCHRPKARMSQLQIRQMQTRSYDIHDPKQALKAVLNVLQDEAFIPREVNSDIGFVHAVKEMDIEDGRERFWANFWHNRADARWRKNSIIECAVNVTELRDGTRVRVNFQVKVLNNRGEIITVAAIEDLAYYQEFFSRVDKGVFLEKEGV